MSQTGNATCEYSTFINDFYTFSLKLAMRHTDFMCVPCLASVPTDNVGGYGKREGKTLWALICFRHGFWVWLIASVLVVHSQVNECLRPRRNSRNSNVYPGAGVISGFQSDLAITLCVSCFCSFQRMDLEIFAPSGFLASWISYIITWEGQVIYDLGWK